MVESHLVVLFPLEDHGEPQLVSASDHQSLGLAIGACTSGNNHGNLVVGFTLDALPFLTGYDGLAWMP